MTRKFKVNLVEDGEHVDSPVAHSWTAFLNGCWTHKQPTRPGKYMIGNKNGRVLGEVFVYNHQDELVVSIRENAICKLKKLEGNFWWWSVRMPQHMPQAVPPPIEKQSPSPPPLKLVVNND